MNGMSGESWIEQADGTPALPPGMVRRGVLTALWRAWGNGYLFDFRGGVRTHRPYLSEW